MFIISQNLSKYGYIPKSSVLRINLAWIYDLNELKRILTKYPDSKIFLDLPKGRTKPPNNKYTLQDIECFFKDYKNIAYFAISNVESNSDLEPYKSIIPNKVTLVPKIESKMGVKNMADIIKGLGDEKIVMLDHDDLYSSLVKSKMCGTDRRIPSDYFSDKDGEAPNWDCSGEFSELVKELIDFCEINDVKLLRTVGVIFSDDEKRYGDYVD